MAISSSYLLFSVFRTSPGVMGYDSSEFYALLARSFLEGKTTLPIKPRPELLSLSDPYDPEENGRYRVNDLSLYKGNYYLYFGAVPAVTLFLPYRLATGRDLPNRVAVPIFCIAGYLSSCALFLLLARHNRWTLPLWLESALIISLGTMSLVYVILRRPIFYEVAIAAGYFCVMGGFLVLARAILVQPEAGKLLLLAGLLFGMAVGCRPHLVVVCGIVLAAFAIRARRISRLVIAMAAGMAVCGLVLAWYNDARFDDPREFGRTYQLTVFAANPISTYYGLELNLDGSFRAAETFLFLAPRVDTHVPFLHTALINPLVGRAGPPIWMEDSIGLVPAAPFALLGLLMPVFLGRRLISDAVLDEGSRWLLYAMYCSGLTLLFVLCIVGWVLERYLVDFAPLFTFGGCTILAALWQSIATRRLKSVFSFAVVAIGVYGCLLNIAFAIPEWEKILRLLD